VTIAVQKYRPCPTFVVKEMESSYIEELKSTISLLMANLESVPVAKGGSGDSKYSLNKFKRYSKCVEMLCRVTFSVASMSVVGRRAQWLRRRSLAGGLCLIYC